MGPACIFVSVAVVAFNDSFSLSEAKWLFCISLLQDSRALELQLKQVGLLG
jgi:hypothetical protein